VISDGFYIAPFAFDGQLEGIGQWSLSKLSPKWLSLCRDLIEEKGDSFQCAIPLPPVHVTSRNGTALVSFRVRDQPATSAALSGAVPEADSAVLRMFVESLRDTPLVKEAATSTTPFEAAFSIVARPLYIVIPWASPDISDADMELVTQFQNHLAGAILVPPSAA
jgi:hypothetical protein